MELNILLKSQPYLPKVKIQREHILDLVNKSIETSSSAYSSPVLWFSILIRNPEFNQHIVIEAVPPYNLNQIGLLEFNVLPCLIKTPLIIIYLLFLKLKLKTSF